MTRITTSPRFVYRDRFSPVRTITSTTRVYRRDVNSPVRIITSPSRIMNIRVRPSTLSREFDRIERKYRAQSVFEGTSAHLNSEYSLVWLNFNFDLSEKLKLRLSVEIQWRYSWHPQLNQPIVAGNPRARRTCSKCLEIHPFDESATKQPLQQVKARLFLLAAIKA